MPNTKDEATLVIIKPDGLQKSMTGNILLRLAQTNLRIVAAKVTRVSRALAEEHYRHIKGKPFFEEVISYIMGELHTNRVFALVYFGPDAINKIRQVCGATNPEEADPQSIRGAFGRITTKGVFENVIHASANAEDAEREIKLWFRPSELAVDGLFPSTETKVQQSVTVWA